MVVNELNRWMVCSFNATLKMGPLRRSRLTRQKGIPPAQPTPWQVEIPISPQTLREANVQVKRAFWSVRRVLGLSPTQQLFRQLRRRGVQLEDLTALEVFGGTGRLHTKDYARQVRRLEIWEIDPTNVDKLRQAFPGAETKCTDSYEEMGRTAKKYELIVVDNPEGAHGQHYEHYDMFPAILSLAADSAVVIIDVRPGHGSDSQDPWDTFDEVHLARRRGFYRTDHPERIAFDEMMRVYEDLIRVSGFELEWSFFHQRTLSGRVHYLVLKVRRSGGTQPAHPEESGMQLVWKRVSVPWRARGSSCGPGRGERHSASSWQGHGGHPSTRPASS